MTFELASKQNSVQFFELFLTLDLVQASDLSFTDPVKLVFLSVGDQPTSLNPC